MTWSAGIAELQWTEKVMDHKKLREEGLSALFNGGSYRDAVETEAVFGIMDEMPNIPLSVPIRFRERYERMTLETHPDS